jgi:hypothetical protein
MVPLIRDWIRMEDHSLAVVMMVTGILFLTTALTLVLGK